MYLLFAVYGLSALTQVMGNPKVMIFYIGFLPALLNLEALASIDVAVVVAVIVANLIAVNVVYTWSAERLARMV